MKNYLRCFRSKVFLCLLSVFLFLWSVPIAYASNKEFTDLPSTQPDYAYIKFLTANNIVNGFADGSFRPNQSISRAEMATLLVKAQQLNDETKSGQAGYNDVAPTHWAYKYIAAASNAGLAKGYANGDFRPEAPVSRAEACAFILRLTSESLPVVAVPASIKDIPTGYWAERQVAVAIDSAMMNPLNESGFSPNQAASRSQVCRALATLLNISPEKSKTSLSGTLVPLKGEVLLGDAKTPPVKISAATSCGLGSKISTGSNSGAEIRFPDGSGLKLDENTEIEIIASNGRSNFSRDGKPENLVDYLEVKISKGRMFGILASAYQNQEKKTAAVSPEIPLINNDAYLTASLGCPIDFLLSAAAAGNTQAPWYKEQYAKKVRVQVDMPFGVASVRGTIWMNEINGSQQITSVADGEVAVSSGGQSAAVPAGMSIAQNSLQAPPAPPQVMNEQQRQLWAGVNSWVNERATAIEQAMPVIGEQNLDTAQTGNSIAEDIINSVAQSTKGGGNLTTQSSASSGGGGSGSSVLNYGEANTTYGPATGTQTLSGNVNISAPGITLRNTIIQGNLLLAEGIGEGNLTLDNVTVTGTTTINGGGPNSIRFINSSIKALIVNKQNN
ncbi:MAG: S-layer homology domain-containing protein [Syntrophomonas sp.]